MSSISKNSGPRLLRAPVTPTGTLPRPEQPPSRRKQHGQGQRKPSDGSLAGVVVATGNRKERERRGTAAQHPPKTSYDLMHLETSPRLSRDVSLASLSSRNVAFIASSASCLSCRAGRSPRCPASPPRPSSGSLQAPLAERSQPTTSRLLGSRFRPHRRRDHTHVLQSRVFFWRAPCVSRSDLV